MLKAQIQEDMKAAMKGGDKVRLGVIRLIMAAIKQREVDERIDLNDEQILAVLDKMVKQRRDSIKQYSDAGRDDLARVEQAEVEIIQDYLPEALSEDDIDTIIEQAIRETGATSMQDMGKVMGKVKPQVQGRADMGAVSGRVKLKLA